MVGGGPGAVTAWMTTREQQLEALRDDIAHLEWDLDRVPHNIVDHAAYAARKQRLRAELRKLRRDLAEMERAA